MNGFGKLILANGDILEGQFENDMVNGIAEFQSKTKN
jgi:hypothetical protein